MLKKFVIALAAISFIVSQGTFFAPRLNAAENAEMIELASGLPESDIVLAMDFDRTLNVAAANILQNDAQKIEHLKSVMKTIENQIGFSPYEVKQIAIGIKLPAGKPDFSLDGFEFAAIARTNLPNGNMLDVWSKRMENILAFNEEKAPTLFYVEEFRRFRDRKFVYATPEKIASNVKSLEAAVQRTQAIGATIDALPKTSVTPAALKAFKENNQNFAATLNKYLTALKADTDTKNYRAETIKLLNRWNALAVDDPQRSAKLAAIKKESEAIYPAYKKKFGAALNIEAMFEKINENRMTAAADAPEWTVSIVDELEKIAAALKELPATKIKRTSALNSLGETYAALNLGAQEPLDAMVSSEVFDTPEPPVTEASLTKTAKGFAERIKQAQREQTVNGKRLVVIDVSKLNPTATVSNTDQEPPDKVSESTGKTENPTREIKAVIENPEQTPEPPQIAIGFLDQNRMVIGLEKSVTAVLKQDAAYKNQKAAAMLDTGKPALFAFAVNSTIAKKVSEEVAKTGGNANAPSILDGFLKDINLYGSVNYDGANNLTNDITMTLGFARENVETIEPTPADGADADKTFEVGGYQFGKALFYDLFNSFKAMQASVTFKFEKKKVASLLKATPRIFDQLAGKNAAPKNKAAKRAKTKRIDSVQDLFTAPQIYVDLVKLFESKAG